MFCGNVKANVAYRLLRTKAEEDEDQDLEEEDGEEDVGMIFN